MTMTQDQLIAINGTLTTQAVTFLLSDVEGSARLWERDESAMERAIPRHYELLDAAILLHGGVRPVEQGEGDSVVGAFADPADALAAALDAQRAFAAEPWPGGCDLRIRIALHTGRTHVLATGCYVGRAVIRCARLRAVAHGGQTVLSAATRDLVGQRLPDRISLRDLGTHRLKDLGEPERVWQLCHPDLVNDFGPLRSPNPWHLPMNWGLLNPWHGPLNWGQRRAASGSRASDLRRRPGPQGFAAAAPSLATVSDISSVVMNGRNAP